MTYANRVKGKGWKPDIPSFKDYPFSMSPAAQVKNQGPAHSESPDRRAENAPVMDQGNLGSCVGCSAGYAAVGWLRRHDRDRLSTDYSALFAYYEARIRDGQQWAKFDTGAYIRDAMDALREVGIPPKTKWPYKISKFADKPPASVYKSAAAWKLGAHYRCGMDDGTSRIEDMMKAIDAKYAVVGGISCYSSMFTAAVDSTGRIPMPSRTDQFEGGHAICFDRYSLSDKLFRFQNSWGADWGDGGYGYIPFAYLADPNLADDFWAMAAEAPETTPWAD